MSALDRLKVLVATAPKHAAPPTKGTDKTDKSRIAPPFVSFVAARGGALSENRAPRTEPDNEAKGWRHHFDERAGIRQFDGGLSRTDAEAAALADLVARWRALHPLPASDASACAHCGQAMARGDAVAVLATSGHAWLHARCWPPMDAGRQATALAAVRDLLESERTA